MNHIKIIILLICFISCDDSQNRNQFNFYFPEDSEISYREHVQPFLNLRCSNSGCHSGFSKAGNIDLSNWFELQKIPGLLTISKDANNNYTAQSSLLLQVINGVNPHLINLGYIGATDNQISGIERWILAGSPNN